MASAANLAILISAKDEASATFRNLGREAQKTEGILGGLGGALGKIGLAGLGISAVSTAISGLVGGSLGAAMESERIAKATEQVIKSTGGAAGVSATAVASLATQLSQLTPFEDEAVQAGENMLLTFTSIGRDIFPQATEAMLNMSQALGQDVQSSAIQLGKALNDPIAGATALRRVGVQLTDAQEAQIAAFVKSGDIMSAQKIILGELQTEFGGMARAAGETTAGKLAILGTQLGNVAEELGGKLMPVVADFASFASSTLVPVLHDTVQIIGAMIEVVGNAATAIKRLFGMDVTNAVSAMPKAVDEATAKAALSIGTIRTKTEQEFDKMVAASTTKLVDLDENYATAMSTIQTSHDKTMRGITEQEARETKDFQTKLGERLGSFLSTMGAERESHAKTLSDLDSQEAKAGKDYSVRLAERKADFGEAMGDIQARHTRALGDIANRETEAKTDFAEKMADRKTRWQEAMTDLKTSHANAIADIQASMSELNVQFAKDLNERKRLQADELNQAPDSYEAAKRAAKSKADELKRLYDEEVAKGNSADHLLTASLRERIDQERAAGNMGYREYLDKLKARQAADEADAKAKETSQLAALQKRLGDEQAEYAKRTAKLQEEYNRDTAGYKKNLAEQTAELATKRTDENAQFEARTAKLEEEYNKDLANFKARQAERMAELATRRVEENAVFEARTAKLETEYQTDIANANTAQAEKAIEFAKRRDEENLAVIVAMASRKTEYQKDVAEVQAAEAAKTATFKEQLAEQSNALRKQVAADIDWLKAAHKEMERASPPGGRTPESYKNIMAPDFLVAHRTSTIAAEGAPGGNITVYVTVQGSVMAEQDLANAIRRQLLRDQRATGGTGFE